MRIHSARGRMPLRRLVVGAACVAAAGCVPEGPTAQHIVLGPDAAVLRTAFNADSGRVRVVMLVSPT